MSAESDTTIDLNYYFYYNDYDATVEGDYFDEKNQPINLTQPETIISYDLIYATELEYVGASY